MRSSAWSTRRRGSSASTGSNCAVAIWRGRSKCLTSTPSARPTTAASTRPTWTVCSSSPTGTASRRADAKARGKILGVGFANYVESSIGSPKERADVIVRPDGVEVVIGTQPAGQGHETSFAQVTADLLGVPFENVTITLGDT